MRDDESLPGVELDDPSSLGSIDDSISSESASLMIPRPIDEARPAELVYAPGQHVASGLRLVHKVGEGGMGEVWRAYHARRGCEVAVKLISATAWAQKNARLRFEREGKVGRMITHPHVVQLLEEGTTAQGLPFLVLELLEGEPLEALLARQPRLSVAEVSRIVLQTASALQEAHRVGVVHRDIKPENIFLVRPPPEIEIKLFDFGIAKKASGHQTKLTAVGTLLGTPFYMNPEQLLDAAPVDYHADLWALSAVAYTALCGTTVFEADTMLGLVKAMRRLAIVPLSAHRPDIGPRLDA
ncbi:MAG: serine/threonine-protein kinase, partial [Myxococcota bacterium]